MGGFVKIDRERYLTLKEAAERSGYEYDHVRRLVKNGSVSVIDIDGRTRLVDWIDLLRYMNEKPQRKPHSDKKKI
jgi:excisionase family DNA binding protein